MTTLKEHQAAMVDLLANGSGIPASASRLAHAMHDVLDFFVGRLNDDKLQVDLKSVIRAVEANSPGLNGKAISKPVATLKTDSLAKWPASAESRIKELENTIRQLRGSNAKLRDTVALRDSQIEQEGFRKDEILKLLAFYGIEDLDKARAEYLKYSEQPEQAGVRKEDTQVCEHSDTFEVRVLGDSQEVEVCEACRKVVSERPV